MKCKGKDYSSEPSRAWGQTQPDPAWKPGKAVLGLVSGLVVCSSILLHDCWAVSQSGDCISLHTNANSADVAASSCTSMREKSMPKALGSQTLVMLTQTPHSRPGDMSKSWSSVYVCEGWGRGMMGQHWPELGTGCRARTWCGMCCCAVS